MAEAGATIGVVLNPRAGGGRALRLLPRLAAALADGDEPSYLHVTERPGGATAVARRLAAAGARLVVAVGGDGTVHEVANGLLTTHPRDCALGVVAAGRGGDFATVLGIPRDPVEALRAACRGEPRPIDVAWADFGGVRRAVVNAGGVGIDAEVARLSAGRRLPGRHGPYLAALAGVLPRFRPFEVTVSADDTRLAGRAIAVVVANGPALGGGFTLLPGARIDDGRLDLAVVGDVSALDVVRHLPRLFKGEPVHNPKFRRLAACSVQVVVSGPAPLRLQLDGEVMPEPITAVSFAIEPAALKVAR